jgi:hypothetical protein
MTEPGRPRILTESRVFRTFFGIMAAVFLLATLQSLSKGEYLRAVESSLATFGAALYTVTELKLSPRWRWPFLALSITYFALVIFNFLYSAGTIG